MTVCRIVMPISDQLKTRETWHICAPGRIGVYEDESAPTNMKNNAVIKGNVSIPTNILVTWL